MSDTAGANAKPSSSVKLVLLGEAAVGKVHHTHLRPPCPYSDISPQHTVTTRISLTQSCPVLSRPPLRQQRLPTEQRTHHRRRLSDQENHPPLTHHKVRNLGHGRPGTLRLAGTNVLPQRPSRPRRLRSHKALLARQGTALGRRAAAPGESRHRHRAGRKQGGSVCRRRRRCCGRK